MNYCSIIIISKLISITIIKSHKVAETQILSISGKSAKAKFKSIASSCKNSKATITAAGAASCAATGGEGCTGGTGYNSRTFRTIRIRRSSIRKSQY
ncbi:hypothetical protein DICPUDRAFT_156613 [Dictyostelium purpureum]|uniref:Uncharacterized protein n=1 Tax=Dictyostelium purpureum TaxID=5786 RepID=F0ZX07_DICPU|nr:uncharacterized protein DICPUDRAFT_156613 [Dictyostelium purpureum]EGC31520.1 hypothetical protein DICPUDRAFT_156613 [Dictyostelium purpureum]|eukprot:XP_003291948.1 hypothetical protein DICPUDRAFT_156613 [Dictyostelium purpureum]